MPRAKKRQRQKKNKAAKALMSQQTDGHDEVPLGNQLCSGIEDCCMAFSPTESPVYGGDELTVTVDNLDLPSDAEFFILYTGSKERRITKAQRINSATFQGHIPDHCLEEDVELEVFCKSDTDGNPEYKRIGNGQFRYLNDSAYALAKKLLDINTDQEITKLEIENENLSTLDTRLKKSLELIAVIEGWPSNAEELNNRDTLLHFAAHHGLSQVVSLVLSNVSDEAIQATNAQGKTARELALDQGHTQIAQLLSEDSTRSVLKSENMMFERNGAIVHKNHNGAISIATPHIDGDSVTNDMDLLNTIEIEMTQKQEKPESSQDEILEEEPIAGNGTEPNLSAENQAAEDISQDDASIAKEPDTDEKETDSLKDSPIEESTDADETITEDEIILINNNDDDGHPHHSHKVNMSDEDSAADGNNIVTNLAIKATIPECVDDKESPCILENITEGLSEDADKNLIEEMVEEPLDDNTLHLLGEKLEIVEEDLEEELYDNKMEEKSKEDAPKPDKTVPNVESLTEMVENSEHSVPAVSELREKSDTESESKEESMISKENQQKTEVEEVDYCYEGEGLEDSDTEASEDEIIDYSQQDGSVPISSPSLADPDTNSFVTARETAAAITEDTIDTEDIPNSAATDTLSDMSMPVGLEISPEDNQERAIIVSDAAVVEAAPLSEEVDSETVFDEPVKVLLEQGPNSDESTDSDSSVPLPPSPLPANECMSVVDGGVDKVGDDSVGRDVRLLNEDSSDEIAKREPLSNGHALQPVMTDPSFTGADNSSMTDQISTGVTGVAFDEIVMLKHNKDKVDLGPVMGEMCILDPLLEERETSEESIGRPPMILRESIEAVRSISRHIQQLRSHGLGFTKNIKGERLQRCGSCPTLDIQGRCTPSNKANSDHHKSMLDLGPGSRHHYSGDNNIVFGTDETSNIYASDVYALDSNEPGVRICINGVTVESSEDNLPRFPSAGSAAASSVAAASTASITSAVSVSSIVEAFIKSTGDGSHTEDSINFSTAATTTTSVVAAAASLSSSTAGAASVLGRGKDAAAGGGGHGDHSVVGYHKETKGHHRATSESSQKNFWNHVKSTMASLGSKSHSLSSLTAADESDEDYYHDARENPTPSQSMMNLSMSPDAYGHPRSTHTAENMYIHNTLLNENNRPPSWPLPARVEHQKIPREIMEHHHTLPSKSPHSSDSADEYSSVANPYSTLPSTASQNITKSLSTSCIPAATTNDDTKGGVSLIKRNNKLYFPNLEENEAFRRQQEIEEIDEVAEMNKEAVEPRKGRDKKDNGLAFDFLSSLPKEEKEKEKKEEKKRRTSVLAKIGSTRKKTKKVKDGKEDNKHKNTHQFVSLSISNTALCHACHKSMANKAAVQCENCLVNVHESSCKDQVAPCVKLINNKFQAPLQEGSSHGQLREKQFASLPAPSSKALDAMKRSSSVPIRPQSTSSIYHQRHSLPNQGIAEENEGPELQEHIHSKLGETISESMESLDEPLITESVDQMVLENDPLLRIEDNEVEAWSISVEKKVVKKLNSKEVKRQDNIYELIVTERNYCRALTIMQKMFFEGLRDEVGVPVDLLYTMFPSLDILLHSHKTFLLDLTKLQSQHKDKIIEEIGKFLIEHFDGENAKTLKQAYGHFCSHHIEAADIYKEKKAERKFLSFVKRCANNTICQKREVPDFLLLVTQRLTKYPTLIEAIIKNTKDKKERENLNKALELVKDILSSVNNQVEEYEREQRFSDIYNRLDARSVLFRSKKFKKTDLRQNNRKLIHDGMIGWKSARGKVIDVLAVVLTDLIVLIQENNQKYTFMVQDNKSCVIPLCELLVREKGDTKDGKGIYLITKKNIQPEMYEFVCKSTEDMKNWIAVLRSAVEQCPQEVVDSSAFQKSEVRRMMEMRADKMSNLFVSMTQIDDNIVKLCEEKKNKINEYVELYHYSTVDEIASNSLLAPQSSNATTSTSSGTTTSTASSSISSSTSSSSTTTTVTPAAVAIGDKNQSKEEGPDASEVLQLAIDEITRLTKVLGSIGLCSTAFVGGGTEHLGCNTIPHATPKRAETFAGFDSLDLRKEPVHKRQPSYVHPEGRSSSMFNLNESEAWTAKNFKSATLHPDATKSNYRKSAGYLPNVMAKNVPVDGVDAAGRAVSWACPVGSSEMLPTSSPSSGVPSIPDATGSPSATSLISTTAAITNTADILSNTVQLSQFLHNFVQLSVQQSTTLEGMRQQLIEAQDKIARLMTEKSEVNKHSQLEGLRNLKEEVTRERQEFEQEKKRRAESLENARIEMQKEWDDIRAQKDELYRKREVLQKQYDLWEEHRHNGAAGRSQNFAEKSHNLDAHGLNHNNTGGPTPIVHQRSASAGLSSQCSDDYMYSGKDLKELSRQQPQAHRSSSSVGNLHHMPIPIQLLSATNEQRVSEKMKQHLPLQLSGTGPPSAVVPTSGKSAASAVSHSQQSGLTRAGLGRTASNASFTQGREGSDLSQIMKLAEPCRSTPKERSQSHSQTGMTKSDQKQSFL